MKDVKIEIKKNNPMLGIFISWPSPQLVEISAANGFDFVIIDGEHGTIGPNGAIENMIMAAYASGIYPIVRVPNLIGSSILQPSDMGAKGIHAPLVNTKEDAIKVIESSKYPPMGKRGYAGVTRAGSYGFYSEERRIFLDKKNKETLIIVSIETKESVSNLDEILSVPGIDAVFIGPNDLSMSLGYPGEMDNPVVVNTIKKIIKKTLKAGVQIGTLAINPQQTKECISRGATYLPVGGIPQINEGLQFMVKGVKG